MYASKSVGLRERTSVYLSLGHDCKSTTNGNLISASSHTSFGRRARCSLFLGPVPFHDVRQLNSSPTQGHRPLFRRNRQPVRFDSQAPGRTSSMTPMLICEYIRIRMSSNSTLYWTSVVPSNRSFTTRSIQPLLPPRLNFRPYPERS